MLSGTHSDILSGILSGIYSDILSGIYSNILSAIRSGILSWPIASRFRETKFGSRRSQLAPEFASSPNGSDPLMRTVPTSWQKDGAEEEVEEEVEE